MRFIDRDEELALLLGVSQGKAGGLVVVYGRRRVGKTRLLLEWSRQADGLYTVADQSAADVQRRYLAETIATRFSGFADVDYRDWAGLLTRLTRDAEAADWRGPVIFDELPYLVTASPELPSVLQRWVDHDAARAKLVVAVAGSSQRMMQGLVLSADAPLYGRARELLHMGPLAPTYVAAAFEKRDSVERVELYGTWGGIPRYWELAREVGGSIAEQIDRLVLDPLGPLHREPDRLLLEELPPAVETRPVLDAIGMGAHRVSEIAGRLGRPATSMARPLDRLVSMGLVRREVPFGESEKASRRSLYRIDDPFFRLWFRVVAPNRALLATGSKASRLALLARQWPGLVAQTWEELCRLRLPAVADVTPLGRLGPWEPASRWWRGNQPEWVVVSRSLERDRILVGEAKWSGKTASAAELDRAAAKLAARALPPPVEEAAQRGAELTRALFVPAVGSGVRAIGRGGAILVVTAGDLLAVESPPRGNRSNRVHGA
jgi:uncharacterized protein